MENGILSGLTDTSGKCVFWGTPTLSTHCVYSEYFHLVLIIFFPELSLFISSILIDWMAADTYFPFSSLHGGHSYHSSYSCHFMAWIFTYTNSLGLHCLGQRDSFFCWVNLLSSWIQFTFPLLLQENVMNILAILLILVYVFKTKMGEKILFPVRNNVLNAFIDR